MAAHKFVSPKTIIITGASSGIGQALAKYYASSGVTLGITGRNAQRLKGIADICRLNGAHVIEKVIDVTNRKEMALWLNNFDDKYIIDMVIANAGISAGTGGVLVGEDPMQVRNVFDVNLLGVLNTIEPVQRRMIERQAGQIVIMSSLAGYRGWPGAPAYCGSKAAVKVYGEALRGSIKKAGVLVNVVCPGFVRSRMTNVNNFPMPFLIEADDAAKIIAKGLRRNKGRIVFPVFPSFIAWFFMILPDSLSQFFLSFSPEKSIKET